MELPMRDLVWFALHSTRRVSEVCRLEGQDNDPNEQTGLAREALRPHEPTARHKRFRMTREAWEIVNRQPRTNEYMFPYKARSSQRLRRAITGFAIPRHKCAKTGLNKNSLSTEELTDGRGTAGATSQNNSGPVGHIARELLGAAARVFQLDQSRLRGLAEYPRSGFCPFISQAETPA
jgi:hypothetical protein